MKKFEIGMVIQAIDKVTGPAKGISAAIRKMSAQAEGAGDKAHKRNSEHGKRHAKEHGHGLGEHLHEGFAKVFEFIPEVAAVAGVVGGLDGLVEGYKKVTEASDAARLSQLNLTTMMMHVKGATKESVKSVMEASDAMEDKSAYKHTIFETAGAKLATFGMNGRQIKSMLPALSDYMALKDGIHATDQDAAKDALLLGKAYAGNTTALRRQGIVLTAAQEAILKHGTAAQRTAIIIKAIESRAGGLAAKQAETPEGQSQRLHNTLEKVSEKVGDALVPIRIGFMKAVSSALPFVNKLADALPDILGKAGGGLQKVGGFLSKAFGQGFAGANVSGFQKTLMPLWETIQSVFRPVIPLLKEVFGFFGKAYGQAAKWLIEAWTKSQPGVKALVKAFGPLIDVLSNLWHNVLMPLWDQVLAPLLGWFFSTLVPFLWNVLAPAFGAIVKVIAFSLNGFVSVLAWLFKGLPKIWSGISNFFTGLWGKAKLAFGVLKTVLTVIWHSLWDGLFKWVEDKWHAFLDIFKQVGNFLGFGGASPAAAIRPGPSTLTNSASGGLPEYLRQQSPHATSNSLSGLIHVSHDPGLKVKVSGDHLNLFDSRLGFQGLH